MAKVKPKNIEQDSSNRFVTDSDKANWNNKQDAATAINTSNIGAQSVNYANTAGSAPASDVYPWAKASTKPTYTKSEVGLSNVDNTSDVDKPVSTAQQVALNNKVDKIAGKGLSTEDYTTSEKSKLAGIEAGANNYVHPATHPATMITEDVTHRFTTDSEKTLWNSNALQLVSKTTISSAVASVEFTGLSADCYKIVLKRIVPATNNAYICLYLGAASYNSVLYSMLYHNHQSATLSNSHADNDTKAAVSFGIGSTREFSGELSLYNMQSTSVYTSFLSKGRHYGNSYWWWCDMFGESLVAQADTAIKIAMSSGNIASGEILLYKLKES